MNSVRTFLFFVLFSLWLLVVTVSGLLSNPTARLLTVVATSFCQPFSSYLWYLRRSLASILATICPLIVIFFLCRFNCIQCNSIPFFLLITYLMYPSLFLSNLSSSSRAGDILMLLPVQVVSSHVCRSDESVSSPCVFKFHKNVCYWNCQIIHCVFFFHCSSFDWFHDNSFHVLFFAVSFESMQDRFAVRRNVSWFALCII